MDYFFSCYFLSTGYFIVHTNIHMLNFVFFALQSIYNILLRRAASILDIIGFLVVEFRAKLLAIMSLIKLKC